MDFIDLKTQYKKYKEEIDQAIHRVLDHGQYILGTEVTELEDALAEYVGVKHAIAVSSGTDTLLLALMALGIGPGDEVITTPFSFIATVEVIMLLGAKPVFVDIDYNTYNIAIDQIEAAITTKTKALMPVSLFGQMPNYDAINEIAKKYHIPVIEDGAQSFGATRNGKQSCGMTTIGSTSFYPAKPLGCYGDGGALFTDDDKLAKQLKTLRVHGDEGRYHHTHLGINGRLDAIQSAILKVKLSHFNEELKLREQIGQRYSQLLKNCCEVPLVEEGATHTYAIYTIRTPKRDQLAGKLKEQGVPTAVYYPLPIYRQPAYNHLVGDFPETEKAYKEVLSLPMHPWLDEATQDTIVETIHTSLTECHFISHS